MSIEAMKLALEALELFCECGTMDRPIERREALRQAIEQAQKQEPDFITHAVENAYDWSEWVCPDPKGYLMKCCDCGLVHEAEFKVVRYKSETEREECDPVDDPNVQAVFRMRRSEQWSPEDTAHRAGGLPMEQAEQYNATSDHQLMENAQGDLERIKLVQTGVGIGKPEQEPVAFSCLRCVTPKKCAVYGCSPNTWPSETPPQRQPLTDEQILAIARNHYNPYQRAEISFARAIEAAHGIKENT